MAILFAWLLVFSQSLPSYAQDLPGHHTAPAAETPTAQQGLVIADGPVPEIVRDTFTITSPPPRPATRPARAGTTVLNNPGSAVQWPFASSPISSGYGSRTAPCRGCSSDHKGLDFTPGTGTPIGAIADGIVRQVNSDRGGFGTHVIVDHQIDGRTVTSLYAHMQTGSVPVNKGDSVTVGTVLGRVGNTGISTGAHLHLEISAGTTSLNPYEWLAARVG